ncbi:unnamed protein product [Vicia faba]|nr:unnamed protein product [Vicia faba]
MATAGHDNKVFIWKIDTFNNYVAEETHSLLITDVRFRPGSTKFVTSFFDISVLNMVVVDMFQGHPIDEKKLEEDVADTLPHVFGGVLLGCLVVCFFCQGCVLVG